MKKYLTIGATIATCSLIQAADWPAYQHDNRRSGITSEQLNAGNLSQTWVFTSKSRPQPAWRGKMARDSYAKRTFQSDSFDYDKAFNLIAADGKVFFGSTSANACIALNASNGTEVWRSLTAGAVRCAPAYDSDRIYFGSDDGLLYCVNADTGATLWTYRGGASNTMIASDHKFISRFPCRTGVLVQNGSVYAGFGLLTWHANTLAKLDAATGAEQAKRVNNGTAFSFEGHMLADATNIYVPQGKNRPTSFRLSDVAHLGHFSSCGGTYATLTASGVFYHGPGHYNQHRTDHMTESNASSRSMTTRHDYLNRIIVNGSDQYKIIRNAVTANGGNTWTQSLEKPVTMILGGNTLYVGSRTKVTAIDVTTGNVLKSFNIEGDAYSLAIADGKLFASTTVGKVYCFE